MLGMYKVEDPFILTIFGASGDLAKLKLFPALYELKLQKRLIDNYYIVGYARTKKDREEFLKEFSDSVRSKHEVNEEVLNDLLKHVYYFSGQYDNEEDFQKYKNFLDETSGNPDILNIAYFSIPPVVFQNVLQNIGETFSKDNTRIILEKPFGENEENAKELFGFVQKYFNEDNVYFLDHFLGKNSIINVLNLRLENKVLNVLLDPSNISNVQINALENVGVANRIGYFDEVGIIKDMIQSHLLQFFSILAMRIPYDASLDAIHEKKTEIISNLIFEEDKDNLTIGQYDGYLNEKDVPEGSKTETFAALKLKVNLDGWKDIPVYMRTGKKLPWKLFYAVIELKKMPNNKEEDRPNRILFEISPEERLKITLTKSQHSQKESVDLNLTESIACEAEDCLPEHGILLLDVIRGKKNNFVSFPEIISSWKIVDKIEKYIKNQNIQPEIYKEGTFGPESQENMVSKNGFSWFNKNLDVS